MRVRPSDRRSFSQYARRAPTAKSSFAILPRGDDGTKEAAVAQFSRPRARHDRTAATYARTDDSCRYSNAPQSRPFNSN